MNEESQHNNPDNERIISISEAKGESVAEDSHGKASERVDSQADSPPQFGGELTESEVFSIIETLLFAAAKPLSAKRINDIIDLGGPQKTINLIEKLNEVYEKENRPYFVQNISKGYQLRTRPEFAPWVDKLDQKQQQDTLSQAALETLAIIAYRQPLTRADIEDIRGVQSGYILRSLIEKKLVKVTGRGEELGRPLLYGTTDEFLEVFGLGSLKDLPALDDPNTPAATES